jgi:hypothetical protein
MTLEVAKKLSLAEQHERFQQQRSRRAVLKGGIIGAGSVLGGAALLSPSGAAAAAALSAATGSKTAGLPKSRGAVLRARVGRMAFTWHDPSSSNLAQNSIASFTTAPSRPGPFTFTAFGDQGVTNDAVGTTSLILAQSPAFHLHAGDISYAESGGDGF